MNPIYILCEPEAYEQARQTGRFAPASLHTEGFIHASPVHQLTRVANLYFSHSLSLKLLTIDPTKTHAPIRWEAASTGDLYPHIYGQLNMDAVIQTSDLERQADGLYRLPLAL